MNFKEFTEQTIERCKKTSACEGEFKALIALEDDASTFIRVLLNNHHWCINNDIYTPAEISSLPADILLEGGLMTQKTPIANT